MKFTHIGERLFLIGFNDGSAQEKGGVFLSIRSRANSEAPRHSGAGVLRYRFRIWQDLFSFRFTSPLPSIEALKQA